MMMMKNALVMIAALVALTSTSTVLAESPASQPNSCPSTSKTFGLSKKQQQQGCSSTSASTTASSIPRGGGGAVLEPSTEADVSGIVLKASAEGKLVVIDFSATWCGPCKMIAPLFEEMANEMPNVVFVKVDVDENPETAAKYSVSAMPTFVFIKNGEVVERLMGANPTRLQALISDHS
mmetsp:Transcript_13073/g.18507  ORF Transcript_13073/g.18507 Transcript_13073/m.18507 type:complete len:179 (-) Transcript_13073:199-735(-)